MPLFVYFKAQNSRGYSCSIHWVKPVDGNNKLIETSHIFQAHDIEDTEAVKGTLWLEKKYPVNTKLLEEKK